MNLYRQGYIKALMDIFGLLERSESQMKHLKINNVSMVLQIIKLCLNNADIFMNYGDMFEFYFRQTTDKKNKKVWEVTLKQEGDK